MNVDVIVLKASTQLLVTRVTAMTTEGTAMKRRKKKEDINGIPKNTKERKISEGEIKNRQNDRRNGKMRSGPSMFFICEDDMQDVVEVRHDGSWFQSIQTFLSVDNLRVRWRQWPLAVEMAGK